MAKNNSRGNRRDSNKPFFGAKSGTTQNGSRWISGWNSAYQSRGLVTVMANATDEVFTSKTGIDYHKYVANVEYKNSGVEKVISGFYNPQKKILYLPKINMAVSLNTRWFGDLKRK